MRDISLRRSMPAPFPILHARGSILPKRQRLSVTRELQHRTMSRASNVCRCSGPAKPNQPTSPSHGSFPEQEAYKALVSELAPMTPQGLREAAHRRPSQLLDSRFLFWLRDQERRPGLGMADRELLSRLGQELTIMREWTEEQSNRTLLPSLASSLSYSNLRRWQEETGAEAPEVVPGVDLEQLYKLGEQEERKLRESLRAKDGETGPRRGVARSGIEEFTKHNKAYADLAAGAIARVRQRFMGFDDDGPSAAAAVLQALLRQMGSSEERATFLPEAFTPPGMQVLPDKAAASTGGGGSSVRGDSKPSFVVTTPSGLMAAARERLAKLTHSEGDETVASRDRLLPSGEDEVAALEELLELIDEYDRQVYSRKTPLERMGHSPGPW